MNFFSTFVITAIAASAPSARIIDPSGGASNHGLLQIETEFGFGTVCGMTQKSAGVVCRQMGYAFGASSTSPCSSYGGSNVCGSAGASVAMKAAKCNGNEATLQECPWEDPDEECASHLSDSVVFCTNHESADIITKGTLRSIGSSGAPSLNGVGRIEIFQDGQWGPVCSDGWTSGSETVACRSMGYSGVARTMVGSTCGDVDGADMCGTSLPLTSNVACSSSESGLLDCQHQGSSDVYCSSRNSVVVSCSGEGNAQGAPAIELV